MIFRSSHGLLIALRGVFKSQLRTQQFLGGGGRDISEPNIFIAIKKREKLDFLED